jgi:anti-sigma factor RsiW
MAHLGDRVTALVDDALDERERSTVQAHLLTCEPCREAVRRERYLKSRMTCGAAAPAPPASLVAALADRRVVAEHVARRERRRLAAVHAAVTVGGLCASLTVLALCAGGSSAMRPPPAGVTRGPQLATTVVSATWAPVSSGAMMGALSGSPASRPSPAAMSSPVSRAVPVSRAGRPVP